MTNQNNQFHFCIIFIAIFISGCATLKPKPPEGITSLDPEISDETFTSVKQVGTPELWDDVVQAADIDGKHRVTMLDRGRESLEVRLNLIRSARKSIKITTYIWKDNEACRILMWEVLRAAKQRGVKVQIVVDHFGIWGGAEIYAAILAVDPNIEIRVYNPIADMAEPQLAQVFGEGLSDLRKINTRLHAKMIIIDDKIALIGGRNISNEYFDMKIGMNFLDRDIIFVGPEIQPAVESFQEIWKCKWSVPAEQLKDVKPHIGNPDLNKTLTRTDFRFFHLFTEMEARADDPRYIRNTFITPMMTVEKARWACDHPKKLKNQEDRFKQESEVTREIVNIITHAEKSLLLQSPYVVTTKKGQQWFAQRIKDKPHLKLQISTNSLAAADHPAVWGALFRFNRVIVQDMGFEFWEMKPIPADIHLWMDYQTLLTRKPTPGEITNWALPPFKIADNLPLYPQTQPDGSTTMTAQRLNPHTQTPAWLCIHSKSIVADDKIAYIGSFNLDPRSADYNIENGLLIEDPVFAIKLRNSIERTMTPPNAWFQALRPEPGRHEPMNRFSEWFPIDFWPGRAVAGFELKPGAQPVPPGHEDFYENWKVVGNYPLVTNESGRIGTASGSKTFGIVVYQFY